MRYDMINATSTRTHSRHRSRKRQLQKANKFIHGEKSSWYNKIKNLRGKEYDI